MLFNLCLHLEGAYVTSALGAAIVLYLLNMVKHRLDVRKRA